VQSDGRFVKVQWSSISLATTLTEWRKLCFFANRCLKNETLAFADDLQRYQNYATCGLKSAAPSCQKCED